MTEDQWVASLIMSAETCYELRETGTLCDGCKANLRNVVQAALKVPPSALLELVTALRVAENDWEIEAIATSLEKLAK